MGLSFLNHKGERRISSAWVAVKTQSFAFGIAQIHTASASCLSLAEDFCAMTKASADEIRLVRHSVIYDQVVLTAEEVLRALFELVRAAAEVYVRLRAYT